MSEADKATDLTGVWAGDYWYGADQNRTPFVATLFETAGSFEGTTLEPAPPGLVATGEMSANIMGARDDVEVGFVKAYDVKTRMKLAPIAYTGVVDEALRVIEGRWRIASEELTGGFVMRRISSPGVMASREIAETARVLETVDAGPAAPAAPARRQRKKPIKAD
jgi:hypothetical protein